MNIRNSYKPKKWGHLSSFLFSFLCYGHQIAKNSAFLQIFADLLKQFIYIHLKIHQLIHFLKEISKNLQKQDYFWQFKDHNSGRKKEN